MADELDPRAWKTPAPGKFGAVVSARPVTLGNGLASRCRARQVPCRRARILPINSKSLRRVDVIKGVSHGAMAAFVHGARSRVIVEAGTLAHSRLLAAANHVCRASLFDEGFAIKPPFQARIPADFIGGRAHSQDETANLLTALKIGALNEAVSEQVEAVAA
jgi:hypothetical protein